MKIVNIHQAKTMLSTLVDAVSSGKEIMITNAGKPVAMLVPPRKLLRTPGAMKGKIHIAEDFDVPLPDGV